MVACAGCQVEEDVERARCRCVAIAESSGGRAAVAGRREERDAVQFRVGDVHTGQPRPGDQRRRGHRGRVANGGMEHGEKVVLERRVGRLQFQSPFTVGHVLEVARGARLCFARVPVPIVIGIEHPEGFDASPAYLANIMRRRQQHLDKQLSVARNNRRQVCISVERLAGRDGRRCAIHSRLVQGVKEQLCIRHAEHRRHNAHAVKEHKIVA